MAADSEAREVPNRSWAGALAVVEAAEVKRAEDVLRLEVVEAHLATENEKNTFYEIAQIRF